MAIKLEGNLSEIELVVFNDQECKLVHFDDACTWASKYTVTMPPLPFGVASCQVDRVSTEATLGAIGKVAAATTSSSTSGTIYYSDVLSISGSASRGFNSPNVSLSSTNVTDNVTATISRGSPVSMRLSWPAKPTGVDAYRVVGLASPYNGWINETQPQILNPTGAAGSTTVYYGDEFEVEATAAVGYHNPTINLTNFTADISDIQLTISAGAAKTYTLTIPALQTGVASLEVKRTSSSIHNQPNTTWSATSAEQKITVYHGDVLSITATAATGYNDPTYTLSDYTVTKDVTATLTAGSLKSYTLTKTAIGSTLSVKRGGSELANNATIYHFDVLTITASASVGYNSPTIYYTINGGSAILINSGSTITVSGDIRVTSSSTATARTLSWSAPPTGAKFMIWKDNGSSGQTPVVPNTEYITAAGSITVYYGEIYTAYTEPLNSTYWNTPTTNWSNNTVQIGTSDVTLTVTAQPKSYTLTLPALTTGIASYTVTRSGTYKTGDWTSASGSSSQQTKTIYYGDRLSISATAQSGYANPSASIAAEVTGPVTPTISRGLKMATLTINKASQASSHLVKRNGVSLASGTTVYEGDVLTASVSPNTGYKTPTLKWHNNSTSASYTVTSSDSSVTSTSTNAGTLQYTLSITAPNASVTVKRGSTTLSNGSTINHFDELTITATPNTGYQIDSIIAAGTSISSGSKITVRGNTSISVNTSALGYVLSWPAKPEGANFTLLKFVTDTQQAVIVENPTTAGSVVLPYGTTVVASYEASNSTYWNKPTVNWEDKTITGDTNFIIYHSPKSYTLSYPKTPTGVTGFKIDRTFTYSSYAGTGNLVNNPSAAGTVTIYYGDTLTATASASHAAYHTPQLSWTSLTVDGNESISFTGNSGVVRAYTLTISPAGHAATHTVSRTSSPYKGASTGTLSNGSTIYYGDTLTASTTGADPYYTPTLNWTSTTVTSNVTSSGTNVGVKSYTLTISKASQAASHTVSRTSSPNGGAGNGSLSSGATIYYGDTLSASVTASTGYNTPSLNWSSTTVYGNVTSTSTNAGAKTYSISKSSPNASVTVKNSSGTAISTVTHFETVTITATPYTNYKIDSIYVNGSAFTNGGSHYVTGPLTISVNCSALQGTLTYPGCSGFNYTILQYSDYTWTPILTNPTSSGTKTLPIGTRLMITYSAATGYNSPTVKINGVTVSDEHEFTIQSETDGGNIISITAGSGKPYTLSYPAKPTGVSSYYIRSNGSIIVNSPSSSGTTTVYYGDSLTISASASSNYGSPTYKFNNGSTSITVTGNVSATVTAGSYSPPVSNNVTFTMDGRSFTVSKGTRWCDLGTTLGYRLYEDPYTSFVTPVNGSTTGPYVINQSTDEPVEWTQAIANGGVYFIPS